MGHLKNPRSGKGQEPSEPVWTRHGVAMFKKLHASQIYHRTYDRSRCTFAETSGNRTGPNRFQSAENAFKLVLPGSLEGSFVKVSRMNLFHE